MIVGAGVLGACINAGGKNIAPSFGPSDLYADIGESKSPAFIFCRRTDLESGTIYFYYCDSSDGVKLSEIDNEPRAITLDNLGKAGFQSCAGGGQRNTQTGSFFFCK